MTFQATVRAVSASALAAFVAGPAHADAVSDYYSGKRLTLVVSYGAGGSYGLYGRLVADHIGKYIPGHPSVVVEYMPGAGGLKATNYLYNAAPKDGSMVGVVTKDLVVAQVLRPKHAKYDASKFNWIGRVNDYIAVILAWAGRGSDTIEDIKKRQTVMGVSGRSHHGYLLASVLNHLIGTKFKLVTGYRGAKAMNIAMESGEVDARIGSSMALKTQLAAQMRDGKLKVVVQSGEMKAKELPNVPLVNDMLKSEADRRVVKLIDSGTYIGWSVLMPPGVPDARVAAWQTALNATVKDPKFLAEAKRAHVDINPKTGQQLAAFVNDVLSTDPAIFKRTRMLVGIKQ